ncbi:MAG: hypothetical protein ABFD96_10040 [Armatimonadia bacterium]
MLPALIVLLAAAALPAQAQIDSDRDGLPDEVEEQLATDPQFAEPLQTIGTFTRPEGPKAAMQFKRVDFGNVGKNRWLWALHFQNPYSLTNAQIIIYLDADNNPATGRTGMGCEYMLSHSEGQGSYTAFAPDGTAATAATPRVAVHNGILYMSVDCPLKQENGKSVFRYNILSETKDPHVSADSTPVIAVAGPPDSEKKVTLTIDEITADENFEQTEGLDLIWKLQADKANVCFRSPDAQLKNMKYYDTEYRWWAVSGGNGSITVTVPKAGTYYPAVVVYDYAGPETYQMMVDGKPVGHFVAAEDDRRQRLHFLSQPLTFKGGEKLSVKVGSVGPHITEDLMLLAQKPPIRSRKFELRQIESTFARQDGQNLMRLTWISTWPTACTVEYSGPDKTVLKLQEPAPVANHRVYLEGLKPGTRYTFRLVAPKPDGSNVTSPDQSFTFRGPQPFAGKARLAETPLKVENPYDFAVTATPISSGVPFAKGELSDPTHVQLVDASGKPVAAQYQPTAYWLDGSIKWLQVSFTGGAPVRGQATYRLRYGTQIKTQPFASPLKLEATGQKVSVATGALQLDFDFSKSALPLNTVATVKNEQGDAFTTLAAPERIELEEVGPMRAVVKAVGHHRNAAGQPFMEYIIRYEFYAGQPFYRLYYTWGNDGTNDFTSFKGLSLSLPMTSTKWTTSADGKVLEGSGKLSLRQMQDNECKLPSGAACRADGWLEVTDGQTGLLVAVRDFWQLYPKAFEVQSDSVQVDLCPGFADGTYDNCSKLDEIKLYFYLMGGKYKVRQGVQKQHELLLYPHSGGFSEPLKQTAQLFQEPLIAACTPERYCGTEVFGEILPATAGRSPEYESVCENVHSAYTGAQATSRNYGLLNFGDQFGERKVNWANGEYDHHHAFLMQFIRTGDRRWYFLGEKAARHAIDVDTCHYGPRLGGEWIHSMGHTGGYFTQQYEGNGIPGGGFTPSHTWTEGFCDWYFVSGDYTASANAALVADHYDGAYLNNYDFSNSRDNGWHLLLTMAAYRATNDPYYLNAARIIVERTIERATPGDKPGTFAGWHRQMVPGHCLDFPRHRGEANFMLGVLANGLEQYYRDVSDPRVAQAIIGGAKQAVAEMWVPECDGFRYTSCPNMKGYVANNDMTAEVLFFAYRLGGDKQHGDIAMRAMGAAFRDGIGSIAHLRWTPHLIYNIDLLKQKGFTFSTKPRERTKEELERAAPPPALKAAKPESVIKLEAESFADQGLAQVQVFERIGNSGKMITYWDQTLGHWLEWKLPVKTTGDYLIFLRYASGADKPPHRALTVDGKSPGAAFDNIELPLTGGFCTQEDNWAFYTAGAGQAVHLEAGEHRLRLTNLGGGVGLDYVVVVPKP